MGAVLQNSLYWGSLYQGLSVHLKMCIRVDCICTSKEKNSDKRHLVKNPGIKLIFFFFKYKKHF